MRCSLPALMHGKRLPKECGRHSSQGFGSPPQSFQRVERRGITRLLRRERPPWSLFVPPGTPDNSPPLQRWDHGCPQFAAPTGATEFCTIGCAFAARDHDFRRFLPSLAGLGRLVGIAFPPLKRWAIVECPWRDKEGSFHWKQGLGQPCLGGVEELLEYEGTRRRLATRLLRKSGVRRSFSSHHYPSTHPWRYSRPRNFSASGAFGNFMFTASHSSFLPAR